MLTREMRLLLARRVSALRDKRGWSQTELARRTGNKVDQKTISNLENINAPIESPTLDSVESVAHALGLELWQLLMPDKIEIVPPEKIKRLLHNYTYASQDGREHIDIVAEREARFASLNL